MIRSEFPDEQEHRGGSQLNSPRSFTQRAIPSLMLLFGGFAGILLLFRSLPAVAQDPIPEDSVPAPELVHGTWLNTPKGQPLKLAARKGKVTIVHFWTFENGRPVKLTEYSDVVSMQEFMTHVAVHTQAEI